MYVKVAVSCRALKSAQVQPDALRSLLAPPWYFSSLGGAGGLCVKCSRVRFLSWQDLWWLTCWVILCRRLIPLGRLGPGVCVVDQLGRLGLGVCVVDQLGQLGLF